MLLTLTLIIVGLSILILLSGADFFQKKRRAWTAFSAETGTPTAEPWSRSGLLDEIKTNIEFIAGESLETPVMFIRSIALSKNLEILVRLGVLNQSRCEVALTKIVWDFWIDGLHIHSGTFTKKLSIGPHQPKRELDLKEVLWDSQTEDTLWAVQKAKSSGYLEGIAYCETAYGRFRKKFSLLNLRFRVSGDSKEERRNSANQTPLDGLTGLQQRTFLEDHLQTIIDHNIHRSPISFAMIDIDDFKKINDDIGHLTGDEVLKTVCGIIKETISDKDIAVRYGGDEIAIILPSCGLDEAQTLMEAIRSRVEEHTLDIPEGIVRATVSIGLAALTQQTNYKVLIRTADNMLRFSKQHGKNKVSVNLRKIGPED